MHESSLAVATSREPEERREPAIVALGPGAPALEQLFVFMRDAELRFGTLRMRVADRRFTTFGEAVETAEVWLRHPGHAKVVTHDPDPGAGSRPGLSRAYRVWVSDGSRVQTYDSRTNTTSVRPGRRIADGITGANLPRFGRVYTPMTDLPMDALADTFIHPHGFLRNVLVTGPVTLLGTARLVHDREALLLRADHPRVTHVLTDRPDRWLQVGVDRMTGLILLLVEHVGERTTRHAEVVDLELDAPIGDEVFTLHLSPEVRPIF